MCAKTLGHSALGDQKEGSGKQNVKGRLAKGPRSGPTSLVGFWSPASEHHGEVLATRLALCRDSVQLNEWMETRKNK